MNREAVGRVPFLGRPGGGAFPGKGADCVVYSSRGDPRVGPAAPDAPAGADPDPQYRAGRPVQRVLMR
jgi:hypothetical protein